MSRTKFSTVHPHMERKNSDQWRSSATLSTTWDTRDPSGTVCLNAISQGDGDSQREGRTYDITSIQVTGLVSVDSEVLCLQPPLVSLARILLVHDKHTNGTSIAGTEVMSPFQSKEWFGFRELDETNRFDILMDKTFVLQPPAYTEFVPGDPPDPLDSVFTFPEVGEHFKLYHEFNPPVRVHCEGASSSITAITDHSLHIVGISNRNNECRIQYYSRVRFVG